MNIASNVNHIYEFITIKLHQECLICSLIFLTANNFCSRAISVHCTTDFTFKYCLKKSAFIVIIITTKIGATIEYTNGHSL